VERAQDRHNAIIGYDLIKATAHTSLAMITFGMQGELPDLPNDIASPHLWSHDFRWGYEGLTRIPWRTIHPLTTAKPSIIHEFGKFGVWPDPDEQALYPPSGYAFPFGDHAKAALIAAGLEHTEERVIANARRLHELSCRNIIEQARRQPGIDGYTVWTGFRGGARSSGFSDDLGRHSNGDPTTYREGCNAPLAVLIDRDFAGRTLAAGADTEVGLYLSNFGATAVANAVVPWQLCRSGTHSREPLVQGRVEHVSAALGQNARVGDIRFDVPHVRVPVQAVLEASVVAGGTTVARNQWDLWLFPTRSPGCDAGVVCDLADPEIERRIVAHLPNTISLRDLDSAVHGCRAWAGMESECLARSHEGILVADRWSDATGMFLELGRTAVLLDTGHLPDSWYPPPVPGTPGSHNVLASFTSFRAGWDQGNMATIIEPHAMLGEFPHEGFCDLQCYAMVQQATPIRTRAVAAGKAVRSRRVVIRSVPKLMSSPSSPRIQDPNAIRAAEIAPGRRIATEDRAYLVEVRVGAGRLIVCTLRCLDDPAGRYLLSQILDYAGTPVAPAPYRGTTPRRPSSEWRLVRP